MEVDGNREAKGRQGPTESSRKGGFCDELFPEAVKLGKFISGSKMLT